MKLRDIISSLTPAARGRKQTQEMFESEYSNFSVWHPNPSYSTAPRKISLADAESDEAMLKNIEDLLKFAESVGGARCEVVGCRVNVEVNPSLASRITGLDFSDPRLIKARETVKARTSEEERLYREDCASGRFSASDRRRSAIHEKYAAKRALSSLALGDIEEAHCLVFIAPGEADGQPRRSKGVFFGVKYVGSSGLLGWVAPHLSSIHYKPERVTGVRTVTHEGTNVEAVRSALVQLGASGVTLQGLIDRSVAQYYERHINPVPHETRMTSAQRENEAKYVDQRLKAAAKKLLPLVSKQGLRDMEKAGLLSSRYQKLPTREMDLEGKVSKDLATPNQMPLARGTLHNKTPSTPPTPTKL